MHSRCTVPSPRGGGERVRVRGESRENLATSSFSSSRAVGHRHPHVMHSAIDDGGVEEAEVGPLNPLIRSGRLTSSENPDVDARMPTSDPDVPTGAGTSKSHARVIVSPGPGRKVRALPRARAEVTIHCGREDLVEKAGDANVILDHAGTHRQRWTARRATPGWISTDRCRYPLAYRSIYW